MSSDREAPAEILVALTARGGLSELNAREVGSKLASQGFTTLDLLAMATSDDVLACGVDAQHVKTVLLAAKGPLATAMTTTPLGVPAVAAINPVIAALESEGMDVAAATTCARSLASEGFTTVESLMKVDEDDLAACGITMRMHIKTILGLSRHGKRARVDAPSGLPVVSPAAAATDTGSVDWSRMRQEGPAWKGHTNTVNCVTVSPNGQFVASGSYDDTVRVWTSTGRLVSVLRAHAKAVNDISFSASGQYLVSASKDAAVKIWDVEKVSVRRTLVGHADRVWCCVFCKQDTMVLSGSEDRSVIVWHAETGAILSRLTNCHGERVAAIAVNADSTMFATASWDKLVKLWALAGHTAEPVATLSGHSMGVQTCKFSANGQVLVTGSNDETVRVWSVPSGQVLHVLTGHFREINSVSVLGNAYIASASCNQEVKIWDMSGRLLKTLTGHNGFVRSVCWAPDGRALVTGSNDYTVRLWSL